MTLSTSEILSAQVTFKFFDKNDDGVIDCDELQTVMKAIGDQMSTAEITDMISEIDADGNGVIDFPEYLTMLSAKSSARWMKAVSAASAPPLSTSPITLSNKKSYILL